MQYELFQGACVEIMRAMPDNSVDSIVTDPPYELGFMGKSWDSSGIANSVEMWTEALRVLKPGGHLLAFSGSRTYHRMTCAIEDAGFEVRDQIMWVYGSGFPKSLDVSKAIDKAAGAVREVTREGQTKAPEDAGKFDSADSSKRERRDNPATDAARQWEGWGTALKPAHEPICVARKPLIGTVAANVLAHGTGALNIDGCRIDPGTRIGGGGQNLAQWRAAEGRTDIPVSSRSEGHCAGRWPANLIHDGSDEVLAAFPDAKGQQGVAKTDGSPMGNAVYGAMNHGTKNPQPRIETSAARFFYCAKTSKADRNAPGTVTTHPTVKPTELMAYLCRLITPPGGLILDPFMGSGSTGKAAMREGFRFIGCELSAEYLAIAEARISHELIGDLL